MKRIALLALVAILGFLALSARDLYSRDASALPQAARMTISKYFKADVSLVKTDKELGRVKDYEVVLTDGTEMKFDRDGNWEDIETAMKKSVPMAIVPEGVANYVKKYHKGQRIIGIERDRSGYDVELSSGLDLKFNKAGEFQRYDD